MSGGFFRGTSAEQDTRFSNKQAKLLKSQKFAPELDHLVDTTKVKMDVMKPWIANKVTELLGFEDEVLINFIYGLLDVKEVNGKEVQICLTGFMEKNTGKFMKELWALLISAQKNTSGVPQQFLDAKEEETRKKKAETDRIRNEIQKTKDKESQDFEQEKSKKLDGGVDAVLEPRLEGTHPFAHLEDEKEIDARNGSRRRCRGTRSRSISKSFSKSRSYSDERRKSGSVSGSSQSRGNSVSSERAHNSPMRKLLSSHKRYSPQGSLSPIRRRSSYSRHRFKSHERHDTHSPARWQRNSASPVRRKRISRSPIRRRHISPSPVRCRSPIPLRCRSRSTRRHSSPYSSRCRSPPCTRRRSPPMRRGSPPMWRRSPSPMHCRSPSSTRYRSPTLMQRRLPSPSRLRSRSPLKRMSSSPVRYRSPSPVRRQHRGSPPILRRSPLSRCRSPIYNRRRSQTPRQQTSSPHDLNSPSSAQHNLLSPARKQSSNQYRRSSVQLHRGSVRSHGKASPAEHEPARNRIQDLPAKSKGHEFVNRTLTSLRSTRSDQKDWNKSHNDVPFCSPSGERSPSSFGSPPVRRDMGTSQDRRPYSSCESPVKRTRTQTLPNGDRGASPRQKERQSHHDSLRTSGEAEEANNDRGDMYQKDESVAKKSGHPPIVCKQEEYSSSSHRKELLFESEKTSGRVIHTDDFHERKSLFPLKTLREDYKTDEKKQCDPKIVKENDGNHWSEATEKSSIKAQQANLGGSTDWDSEGSDKYRVKIKEKRKHRRSCKYKSTSDDFSYDSEEEERKEAKRRRKEEKRRRKEEKRHRREERHRIREERHAEKLQARSTKTVKSLPNYEKNRSEHDISDGECVVKRMSQPNDGDEPETKQQKQLEIELRQKALESLRAKKGICH